MKEIEKSIKDLLSEESGIEVNNIHCDSLLKEDLGLDSFDYMEMVFPIEDMFNISIEDNEMFEIRKVKDIVELVREKIGC